MELQPLIIESSDRTPYVKLDKESSLIVLQGNTYPEDAHEFFRPIMRWIYLYIKNPNPHTHVDLMFTYLNSTSERIIFDLIERFQKLYNRGYHVTIRWYYEEDDDDMYEKGLEFHDKLTLSFEFHELTE